MGRSSPSLRSFQETRETWAEPLKSKNCQARVCLCPKMPGNMEEGPSFPLVSQLWRNRSVIHKCIQTFENQLTFAVFTTLKAYLKKITCNLYWSVSKKKKIEAVLLLSYETILQQNGTWLSRSFPLNKPTAGTMAIFQESICLSLPLWGSTYTWWLRWMIWNKSELSFGINKTLFLDQWFSNFDGY